MAKKAKKDTNRKVPGEFSKRKQKVGKKKLQPTNATSTVFKAKSIHLSEQSIGADKGQPTSHRKLTMSELVVQLNHYSADVRHDALKGLTELIGRHPEALPPVAPAVLDKALLMFEDEQRRVRHAALALLRVAAPVLAAAGALGPHEQALRLRLQSSLSYPER